MAGHLSGESIFLPAADNVVGLNGPSRAYAGAGFTRQHPLITRHYSVSFQLLTKSGVKLSENH